jgi:hypothetical protein
MKGATLPIVVIALVACTTSDPSPVTAVATSPLSDVNLVRAKIPPVLAQARIQPYAVPEDQTCEALAADVRTLDEVLGPDVDAPDSESDAGSIARGSSAVGHEAVGALQGVAEDFVPFRHWVRKLSGAEHYSKKVAAAIVAGSVRRGFLKGIMIARDCP